MKKAEGGTASPLDRLAGQAETGERSFQSGDSSARSAGRNRGRRRTARSTPSCATAKKGCYDTENPGARNRAGVVGSKGYEGSVRKLKIMNWEVQLRVNCLIPYTFIYF